MFQFFETKSENLTEILEKEDWNAVTVVSPKIQNLMKFILENNFIELKFKDKNLIQEAFNLDKPFEYPLPPVTLTKSVSTNNIPLPGANQEENKINPNPDQGLLFINESKFKVTNSSLELLYFVYDTAKVICYFDSNLSETIVYQFVKIVKYYLNFSKEIIIQGEGVKKGKMKSISQKEISLLCANICILETVILQFIKNFSCQMMDEKQEIIIPSLNELLSITKKMHNNCKEKINELFQTT